MRSLTKEEFDLIAYMLNFNPTTIHYIASLPDALVEEMNDGGMGSLKFFSNAESRRMKVEVARIDLRDSDGIPLSITINTDMNDDLYELDVFKADFSPLKQFPVPPYIF
jgi:hypothetical protein